MYSALIIRALPDFARTLHANTAEYLYFKHAGRFKRRSYVVPSTNLIFLISSLSLPLYLSLVRFTYQYRFLVYNIFIFFFFFFFNI